MKFHDGTLLEDLGIDKKHSHRWQLLVRMDEAEFEAELAACIEAGNELTLALMYRSAKRTGYETYDTGPIEAQNRCAEWKIRKRQSPLLASRPPYPVGGVNPSITFSRGVFILDFRGSRAASTGVMPKRSRALQSAARVCDNCAATG